jgi:hypothetical protein
MVSFRIRTSILFAAVVAILIGMFELSRWVYWGQGGIRGAALIVVAVLLAAVWQPRRVIPVSPRAGRIVGAGIAAALAVAIITCLLSVTTRIRLTAGGSDLLLDQGQLCHNALRLLDRGINPYGLHTMDDPMEYENARTRIMSNSSCLIGPAGDFHPELDRYWKTLDIERARTRLYFVLDPSVACQRWTTSIHSLGFKYGPVLLASYWPFVKLWGAAGIYVNHLVLFLLFATWLFVVCWRRYDHRAGIFLIPLLVFLVPRQFRQFILHYSGSDLLSTATAIMAAWCCLEKRFTAMALLLAASVGAKPLPGMLYLPLLTAARPKHWLWFLGAALVIYGPVFAWDFQGAVNNLVLFNFLRDTDSTALLHYLPPILQRTVPLLGLAAILRLARRACLGEWAPAVLFEYLVGAHLLLLFSGRIFHNNYLVWLEPLVGLALAEAASGTAPAVVLARAVPETRRWGLGALAVPRALRDGQ